MLRGRAVCYLTSSLTEVIKERKEAFAHLVDVAVDFGADLDGFLAGIALHTDTDTYTQQAEKVSLMTMHAAKGLERQHHVGQIVVVVVDVLGHLQMSFAAASCSW